MASGCAPVPGDRRCQGSPRPLRALDGPLRWAEAPLLFAHPTLRGDWVLTGRVVNDSLLPLTLRGANVTVRTADGRLRSAAAFASGYAPVVHLWNGRLRPPRYDLARVGIVADLAPGASTPLTVSWSGSGAVRVDYGQGSLAVPSP